MRRRPKLFLMIAGTGSIVLVILTAIFLIVAFRPTNDRDNADPATKRKMLAIALKVGNLAPIPKNAVVRTISTEGSAFTRQFTVIFDTDPATMQMWLRSSKGIRTASIEKKGNIIKYVIRPRLGYQDAEVLADSSRGKVRLRVCWS